MYFLHNDSHIVTLHPSYFSKETDDLIKVRLLESIEGTIKDDHYIICVVNIQDPLPEGRILPGSGLAEYDVGYRAVVWKPFKGECVRDMHHASPPRQAHGHNRISMARRD